jgi:hypothetical protein
MDPAIKTPLGGKSIDPVSIKAIAVKTAHPKAF